VLFYQRDRRVGELVVMVAPAFGIMDIGNTLLRHFGSAGMFQETGEIYFGK
jgi:hypothetical protein